MFLFFILPTCLLFCLAVLGLAIAEAAFAGPKDGAAQTPASVAGKVRPKRADNESKRETPLYIPGVYFGDSCFIISH